MTQSFADTLAGWTPFYGLLGGAAATLLGLLFVAVSLRLNIFRQAAVADIRLFAGFTLGTFLTALAISALALAPHLTAETLAVPLAIAGVAGLVGAAQVARLWTRLNFSPGSRYPGRPGTASFWRGIMQAALMTLPFLGLLVVAYLLASRPEPALALLAILDAGLLALGTQSSWLLLSHAGVESSERSAGS